MIAVILYLVGGLVGSSLIVAAVVAVVVILWAQDTAAALAIIRYGYFFLIGILPIALWLSVYITLDEDKDHSAYGTLWRAILTTVQGAAVGSILGAGPICLAVIVNLPVIVAGFSLDEFGPAVRDAIVWSQLWLAVAATVLSAFPLGMWAHYARAGRDDD